MVGGHSLEVRYLNLIFYEEVPVMLIKVTVFKTPLKQIISIIR